MSHTVFCIQLLLYRRQRDQERHLNVKMYDLVQAYCAQNNRSKRKCPLKSSWLKGDRKTKPSSLKLTSLTRSLSQLLPACLASTPRRSAGVWTRWTRRRRAAARPEPGPGWRTPSAGPVRWPPGGVRSAPGQAASFWSTAPAGASTPRQRGAAEWGRRKVCGWPWRCCSKSCPPAACNRWRRCCGSPAGSRSAHPGRCPVHICGLNKLACEDKRRRRAVWGWCVKPSRCKRNNPVKPDTSNQGWRRAITDALAEKDG